MAKMIPSVISPEVKSNAEKKIFEWFRDDPQTEDWIVLHSLGIANHNKVMHGETDFFVLAPDMGLFAIEVKGGRVRRESGEWSFTDKYGNVNRKQRGPFDQAWDGIFSIIADLKKKLDTNHRYLENVFFGIGVMFPDVEYDSVGCDEEQWQVFDCNNGNRVGDYVKSIFENSRSRWKEIYDHDVNENRLPSEDDVKYIASILRGDFDKAVAVSVQIKYSEEELIRLTDEQYRCIDQLDDNKRCLIMGGAGTGKTLLAIEEAKKAAASGLKVALFCYNRNLGEWFEKYFDDLPQSLKPSYVGTFHKFMIRSIKQNGVKLKFPDDNSDNDSFYNYDIPIIARKSIQESRDKFDKIIIDEAQDIISDLYLDVIDVSLHGGLSVGRWTMLGDFSQQAIYTNIESGDKLIEKLEEKTSFIRFKLNMNCRNTKTICDEISMVTGYKPPSDVWSKVEGIPVEYLTYGDDEEEKDKLTQVIASLIKNHISPKMISILSPVKRENSIVSLIEEYDIKDYKVYSGNRLAFSTIQAFKGLENTVVILVDIDSLEDKRLLYVALSRARAGLYVILSNEARKEYVDIQIRRLKNGQ